MLDIPNLSTPKSKIKFLISEDTKLPAKGILPSPPATLEETKERIRTAMKAIEASADAIRKRAIEIGRDLITMKPMVDHGNFLDYVKAEFGLHPRTAQRYMRVWEFVETNPDFMDEAPELSALYALMEGNFAPEVLECIKEAMKKGSVPKTKAGIKKAVAAKTSSAVVKSKKSNASVKAENEALLAAMDAAAQEAVDLLKKRLGAKGFHQFLDLYVKAGLSFHFVMEHLTEGHSDGPH